MDKSTVVILMSSILASAICAILATQYIIMMPYIVLLYQVLAAIIIGTVAFTVRDIIAIWYNPRKGKNS